ncbi:hypothetical protein L6452_02691 [Arctium lappa]|uniref:Uncharacterized protein n=1 Tax=Arctium lappa TaxID=4217 RepID=A0ACB9FL16_ARCLA|nr:hypothetical protein L6452_02691 [Arctium lappa]
MVPGVQRTDTSSYRDLVVLGDDKNRKCGMSQDLGTESVYQASRTSCTGSSRSGVTRPREIKTPGAHGNPNPKANTARYKNRESKISGLDQEAPILDLDSAVKSTQSTPTPVITWFENRKSAYTNKIADCHGNVGDYVSMGVSADQNPKNRRGSIGTFKVI